MGTLRTQNSCFARHLPLKTIASCVLENEIDWSQCVVLTNDWARAMSGI